MKKQLTMSASTAVRAWLDAESASFTAICGEKFTHAEVIMTAVGTIALMAAVAVGGAL